MSLGEISIEIGLDQSKLDRQIKDIGNLDLQITARIIPDLKNFTKQLKSLSADNILVPILPDLAKLKKELANQTANVSLKTDSDSLAKLEKSLNKASVVSVKLNSNSLDRITKTLQSSNPTLNVSYSDISGKTQSLLSQIQKSFGSISPFSLSFVADTTAALESVSEIRNTAEALITTQVEADTSPFLMGFSDAIAKISNTKVPIKFDHQKEVDVTANAKGLSEQIGGAVKEGFKGSKVKVNTFSPVGNIFTGFFEGIGGSISKKIGEGISQGIENRIQKPLTEVGKNIENYVSTKTGRVADALLKNAGLTGGLETVKKDFLKLGSFVDSQFEPEKIISSLRGVEQRLVAGLENVFVHKNFKKLQDDVIGDLKNTLKGLFDGVKNDIGPYIGAGLKTATFPLRINQQVQATRAFQEAKKRSESIQLTEAERERIQKSNSVVMAIGGFGGEQGKHSHYAGALAQGLFKESHVIPVENPYTDSDTATVDDILKQLEGGKLDQILQKRLGFKLSDLPQKLVGTKTFTEKISKLPSGLSLEKMVVTGLRGFNPDAIEVAAKALAVKREFEDKQIYTFGFSAGGHVADQAVQALAKGGINAKGVGIGTPYTGLAAGNNNPDSFKSILGNLDYAHNILFKQEAVASKYPALGNLPQNIFNEESDLIKVVPKAGKSHNLGIYLSNENIQKELAQLLPLAVPQQEKRDLTAQSFKYLGTKEINKEVVVDALKEIVSNSPSVEKIKSLSGRISRVQDSIGNDFAADEGKNAPGKTTKQEIDKYLDFLEALKTSLEVIAKTKQLPEINAIGGLLKAGSEHFVEAQDIYKEIEKEFNLDSANLVTPTAKAPDYLAEKKRKKAEKLKKEQLEEKLKTQPFTQVPFLALDTLFSENISYSGIQKQLGQVGRLRASLEDGETKLTEDIKTSVEEYLQLLKSIEDILTSTLRGEQDIITVIQTLQKTSALSPELEKDIAPLISTTKGQLKPNIDIYKLLTKQVSKLSNASPSEKDAPTIGSAVGGNLEMMELGGLKGLYNSQQNRIDLIPELTRAIKGGKLSEIPRGVIGLIAHELRHGLQTQFGKLSQEDFLKGNLGVKALVPTKEELAKIQPFIEGSVAATKGKNTGIPEEIIRKMETDAYTFELRYGEAIYEAMQSLSSEIESAIEDSKGLGIDISEEEINKKLEFITEKIFETISKTVTIDIEEAAQEIEQAIATTLKPESNINTEDIKQRLGQMKPQAVRELAKEFGVKVSKDKGGYLSKNKLIENLLSKSDLEKLDFAVPTTVAPEGKTIALAKQLMALPSQELGEQVKQLYTNFSATVEEMKSQGAKKVDTKSLNNVLVEIEEYQKLVYLLMAEADEEILAKLKAYIANITKLKTEGNYFRLNAESAQRVVTKSTSQQSVSSPVGGPMKGGQPLAGMGLPNLSLGGMGLPAAISKVSIEEARKVQIALGELAKSSEAIFNQMESDLDRAISKIEEDLRSITDLEEAITKQQKQLQAELVNSQQSGLQPLEGLIEEINVLHERSTDVKSKKVALESLRNSTIEASKDKTKVASVIGEAASLAVKVNLDESDIKQLFVLKEELQKIQDLAQGEGDRSGDTFFSGIKNSLQGLGKQVWTVINGFLAFQTLTSLQSWVQSLGASVFEVTNRFITLEKTIKFISGGESQGKETLAFLKSETDRVSGNYQAAIEGYKQISASSRGTRLEGEPTREIFGAVNQASSVYGLTNEQTSGALLAVSQMISKGCYDEQTEVLTSNGWIKWKEATSSHLFASLNITTGEVAYQHSLRMVRYRHQGKMLRIVSGEIDLLVTPDHRLLVEDLERPNKPQIICAGDLEFKPYYFLITLNGDKTLLTPANWQWIDNFDGEVFCAEVGNTTLFVRRNERCCWSGNSIQAEELRGQLSERIPGALQIMARALGVTEQQLGKLLESGSLGASEVLPKFARQLAMETSAGVAGAANSSQGAVNNLNSAITKLQVEIGKNLIGGQVGGMKLLAAAANFAADNIGILSTLLVAFAGTQVIAILEAVKASGAFKGIANAATLAKEAFEGNAISAGILKNGLRTLAASTGMLLLQMAAIIGVMKGVEIVWGIAGVAIGKNDLSEWADRTEKNISRVEQAMDRLRSKDGNNNQNQGKKPEEIAPSAAWWDIVGNTKEQLAKNGEDLGWWKNIASWGDVLKNKRKQSAADQSISTSKLSNAASELISGFTGGKSLEEAIKASKKGVFYGNGALADIAKADAEIAKKQIEKQAILRTEGEGSERAKQIQSEIDSLTQKRAKAAKEVSEVRSQLSQQIQELKEKIKNESDPQIKAGMESDLQALEKFNSQLQRIETQAGTSSASAIVRFTETMRELSIAISESAGKAQEWLTIQNTMATKGAIEGFSRDRLANRNLQSKQLENQRDALKQQIKDQEDAAKKLGGLLGDENNQSLLKAAGVDNSMSPERLRSVAEATKDAAQKKAIESLAQAKELNRDRLRNEEQLAQTELQIKQQAEQAAIAEIQRSAAIAQAATRQSENARVAEIQKAGASRRLTEEQVAEEIASIQLDSKKQSLLALNSEERQLEEYYRKGIISAEQYDERKRELASRLSDEQKALSDSEIALTEATNRRKLADYEFALKKREALTEASLVKEVNRIKGLQASGKISGRQAEILNNTAQRQNLKEQRSEINTQINDTYRQERSLLISPRQAEEKRIQLKQKLGQIDQQIADNQIQANEQALRALELANQRAEAFIEISQQKRINIIKAGQAKGDLSDRQAQQKLNAIQNQTLTKQISETQRKIAENRNSVKKGLLSPEEGKTKELELQKQLAQQQQQLSENIIQKKQGEIQKLELLDQRRLAQIEINEQKKINAVKAAQAKGDLSDRQVQQKLNILQGQSIAKQISETQRKIAQNRTSVSKGLISPEEGKTKEIELQKQLAQQQQQLSENTIQRKQNEIQRLEFLDQRRLAQIEINEQKKISAVKAAQAKGELSDREVQQKLNAIQGTTISKQIGETQFKIAQNRNSVKKGLLSSEDGRTKEIELQKQLVQQQQQLSENVIQKKQNELQRLESLDRRRLSQIEVNEQKKVNAVKTAQAAGDLSDREAQAKINLIQGKAIANRITLLKSQIEQEKVLLKNGTVSKEDSINRQIELQKQLGQVTQQQIDNEIQNLANLRAAIDKTIEIREAQNNLVGSKAQLKLASKEADAAERTGKISPLQELQFEQQRLAIEADRLSRQKQTVQERLDSLPQKKLSKEDESLERLRLQEQLVQATTSFEQNRKAKALNKEQLRDKLAEMGISGEVADSALEIARKNNDLARKEADAAIASDGMSVNNAITKIEQDRARLQALQTKLLADKEINRQRQTRIGTPRTPEEKTQLTELKKEAVDIDTSLQENRRDLAANIAEKRNKIAEINMAKAELEVSQRQLEISKQELTVLRSGLPYNQQQYKLQADRTRIINERQTLLEKERLAQERVDSLKPGASEEVRIRLNKELNEAKLASLENEKALIQNNRELAISKIEQEISYQKRLSDEKNAGFEKEKQSLEISSKLLDIRKQLIDSQTNLQKAISDAELAQTESKLNVADRAVEAARRLKEDENLSPEVRAALQSRLSSAGLSSAATEDDALANKQRIENELAQQKIATRLQEEEIARRQLEIEAQRGQMAAEMQIAEANITLLKSQQAELDAKLNLQKATRGGDSEAIANAQSQLELASQSVSFAEMGLNIAQQNLDVQQEIAANDRDRLTIQQQSAAAQSKAAEEARQQDQALTKAEARAKGIANANKSSSGSSGGAGSGSGGIGGNGLTLVGDSIWKYSEARQQFSSDLQGDKLSMLQGLMGLKGQNPWYQYQAERSGMQDLVKLANSLKSVGSMTVQATISDAQLRGQDVIAALQQLGDRVAGATENLGGSIDRLSQRPVVGSLSISSPNPIADSSNIINGLATNSVRGFN